MERLRHREGLSPQEVAVRVGRDVRTVRSHLDPLHSSDSQANGQRGVAIRKGESDDPELGPHMGELFYFGRRFRDRLELPEVSEYLTPGNDDVLARLWLRRPLTDSPRTAGEEEVECEWRLGRFDARTHSVYPLFRQHLDGHSC